jgi:hypothetical protein
MNAHLRLHDTRGGGWQIWNPNFAPALDLRFGDSARIQISASWTSIASKPLIATFTFEPVFGSACVSEDFVELLPMLRQLFGFIPLIRSI